MSFAASRHRTDQLRKRSFDDFSHETGEVGEQPRTKPSHPIVVEARPKEQVSVMPGAAVPAAMGADTSRSSAPRLVCAPPARGHSLPAPQGPFAATPNDLIHAIAQQLDLQSFGRVRRVSTSLYSILSVFTGGLLGQKTAVNLVSRLQPNIGMIEKARIVRDMGRLLPRLALAIGAFHPKLGAVLLKEGGWQELIVSIDDLCFDPGDLMALLENLQCVGSGAEPAQRKTSKLRLNLSSYCIILHRGEIEDVLVEVGKISRAGRLDIVELDLGTQESRILQLLDPLITPHLESLKVSIDSDDGRLALLGQLLKKRPGALPRLTLIDPGLHDDILREALPGRVPRQGALAGASARWVAMFIELGSASLEVATMDFEDSGPFDALEDALAQTQTLTSLTIEDCSCPFAFAEEAFVSGMEKNTSLLKFKWDTSFGECSVLDRADPIDWTVLTARLLCAVLSHKALQQAEIHLPEPFRHVAMALAPMKPHFQLHFYNPFYENCSAGLLTLEAFRKKQQNDGSEDAWYEACFG